MLEGRGPEEAGRFASQVFTLLLLSQIALLLALVYLDHAAARAVDLARGSISQPDKFDNAVAMSRIMFPYIAFIAVFALHQGTPSTPTTCGARPLPRPLRPTSGMIAFLAFAAFLSRRPRLAWR